MTARTDHYAKLQLELLEDRTLLNAVLVKDIFLGENSSFPRSLIAIGNSVIFVATNPAGVTDLWRSDGTEAGTRPFLLNGAASADPYGLTPFAGGVIFFANARLGNENEAKGFEPMFATIDGVVTRMRDILPGPGSGGHPLGEIPNTPFQVMGNYAYFAARTTAAGNYELWRAGTQPNSTQRVFDTGEAAGQATNPDNFAVITSETGLTHRLYFSAERPAEGNELWRVSVSSATGGFLSWWPYDIRQGLPSSSPTQLVAAGQTLYFVAQGNNNVGRELHKLVDAQVSLVKDIAPGVGVSSDIQKLTSVGDSVFFFANNGTNGSELWKSSGTAGSTYLVKNINPGAASSNPGSGYQILANAQVPGAIFFAATNPTYGIE